MNKVDRFETKEPELIGSEKQDDFENVASGIKNNGDDNPTTSKQNESSDVKLSEFDIERKNSGRSQCYNIDNEDKPEACAKLDKIEKKNGNLGVISSFLVGNWLHNNFEAISPELELETGPNTADEESKFSSLTQESPVSYRQALEYANSDSENKGENHVVNV